MALISASRNSTSFELAPEHDALMAADAPLQGELQLGLLLAQAGLGQLGQLSGILLTLGDRAAWPGC